MLKNIDLVLHPQPRLDPPRPRLLGLQGAAEQTHSAYDDASCQFLPTNKNRKNLKIFFKKFEKFHRTKTKIFSSKYKSSNMIEKSRIQKTMIQHLLKTKISIYNLKGKIYQDFRILLITSIKIFFATKIGRKRLQNSVCSILLVDFIIRLISEIKKLKPLIFCDASN